MFGEAFATTCILNVSLHGLSVLEDSGVLFSFSKDSSPTNLGPVLMTLLNSTSVKFYIQI